MFQKTITIFLVVTSGILKKTKTKQKKMTFCNHLMVKQLQVL